MGRNGETLEELILDRKGTRTYAELSKLCGGSPHPNRLQFMAVKGIQDFPSVGTIENLSTGLDVSVLRVVMAAGRSLELNMSNAGADDLVLRGAGRLPKDSQELLVNMSRQLQDTLEPGVSGNGVGAKV